MRKLLAQTDVPKPLAIAMFLMHGLVALYYWKDGWFAVVQVFTLNVILIPAGFVVLGMLMKKADPAFKLLNAYYLGLAMTFFFAMALFRNK